MFEKGEKSVLPISTDHVTKLSFFPDVGMILTLCSPLFSLVEARCWILQQTAAII